MMYYISMPSQIRAAEQAKILNIPIHEWVYVTQIHPRRRADTLRGVYVKEERYLIGYFSDEERTAMLNN